MEEASEGSTGRTPVRHIAIRALAWAFLLTFFLTIVVAARMYITDPLSVASSLMLGTSFGFLLLFTAGLCVDRLRSYWRRWRLRRALPSGPTLPFHWTGRPWQLTLGPLMGLVLGATLSISFLLATSREAGSTVTWAFVMIAVGMAVISLFHLMTGRVLRPRTFIVDESGVRCQGRPGNDFDVPWDKVRVVELVRFLPPFELLPQPAAKIGITNIHCINLRGADQSKLARMVPQMELGAKVGRAFAEGVLEAALRRGIPMRHVSGWRRPRSLDAHAID